MSDATQDRRVSGRRVLLFMLVTGLTLVLGVALFAVLTRTPRPTPAPPSALPAKP